MVVNTNEQPKQRNWCKNGSRTQILRSLKNCILILFQAVGLSFAERLIQKMEMVVIPGSEGFTVLE